MMKTSPASSFIMTQSKFLLQFFVIPLDDPALLGHANKSLSLVSAGRESQYLVGSASALGHSISSHCSG